MLQVKWLHSLTEVEAGQWDRLFAIDAGTNSYPFCQHSFLLAMEQGGSIGGDSGWQSRHLSLWYEDRLVAAVPGYLKRHSYGEYLFDWQIADAYHQLNLMYYPKWIAAIPFTPVAGPRLGALNPAYFRQAMTLFIAELTHAINSRQFCSVQWLYINLNLQQELTKAGFLERKDIQYLWHNQGYQRFDDYLNQLTSRKRKQIRQERDCTSGFTLATFEGTALTAKHWQAIIHCYQATYLKRSGHRGYISPESFYRLGRQMGERLVVFAALADNSTDNIVAMALCFKGSDTLYGRYWGALTDTDKLHFELCYYQGIEYCIKQSFNYFDAGAQGQHKLKRGFKPVTRYGSYLFADTLLSGAIADYFNQEAAQLEIYSNQAVQALPFKKTQL